jgi:predicted dehydrogenase
MIKAGLIGFGWWGQNIARAIQGKSQHLQFSLAVSKETECAAPVAAALGMRLTSQFEEVLADPSIQAVVLATPHSLHADQIVAAAKAGKHVFCEKPLALTHADAKRAINECQSHGLVLAVGQNKRFWPSMVKLRELVTSGVLGHLMHIEGHYSNEHSSKFFSDWRDSPHESPAGGLTGTGIHLVDAFVGLAGPAASVLARVHSVRSGSDPRDATSVLIEFKNGIHAYFAMVRATPIYWRVHVFGDKASVEALGENEVVIRHQGGRIEKHILPPVDSLLAELDAFARAIPRPGHIPIPYPITAHEMSNVIGLFEAIVQSINSQQPVGVSS